MDYPVNKIGSFTLHNDNTNWFLKQKGEKQS